MLFVRYSLGEEVTLKQITAHIATHGADGKLNLQQFKEVMMKVIGVSHTKEQLTASLLFVSRDKEWVPASELEALISAQDFSWLVSQEGKTRMQLFFSAENAVPDRIKYAFKMQAPHQWRWALCGASGLQ